MISHDHPRFSDTTYRPFSYDWSSSVPAATCAICSGDAYPTKETHMGAVCSACTTLCPGCGDWLCNDPAIEHKGAQWHIGCAIEDADEAHPVDLIITPAQCIALAEYSDLGGAA